MTDAIDAVRARFRDGRCHQVVLQELLAEERAAPMRDQLDAAGFEPYYEPDRGRYELNRTLEGGELFEELRQLAELIAERPVTIGPFRWTRHRHRDYALIKDDAKPRLVEGAYLELILDFSARATGQAEIVYTEGKESWPIPQMPGALAVVERAPGLYRYERYLDHRVADTVLHRLRLALL
jgi:hypothetical protein